MNGKMTTGSVKLIHNSFIFSKLMYYSFSFYQNREGLLNSIAYFVMSDPKPKRFSDLFWQVGKENVKQRTY